MKRKTIAMVLTLLFCTAIGLSGCKSEGFKVENPFAKKPKAPSKNTPAEIDGIQLSAPPEKYTKELTKNDSDRKDKDKLAQKGKYETFPSSKDLKVENVAMNPTNRTSLSSATNRSVNTAMPGMSSPSTNNGMNSYPGTSAMPQQSTPVYNTPAPNYPAPNYNIPTSNPVPSSMPAMQNGAMNTNTGNNAWPGSAATANPNTAYPSAVKSAVPAANSGYPAIQAPQAANVYAQSTAAVQPAAVPQAAAPTTSASTTPFPSYGQAPATTTYPAVSGPQSAPQSTATTGGFAPGSIGGY